LRGGSTGKSWQILAMLVAFIHQPTDPFQKEQFEG